MRTRLRRVRWFIREQPYKFVRLAAASSIWGWLAPRRQYRRIMGRRFHAPLVEEARGILVIRPDELGDVVLSTPFLRELRKAAPRARITLVVKGSCRELVEYCPFVDRVVTYNWEHISFEAIWRPWQFRWAALRTRFGALRGRRFDLVLIPRRDADYYGAHYLAHLCAGRAAVVAHQESVVVNSPPAWLPDFPPDVVVTNPRIEHETEHGLSFLRALGASSASGPLEVWLSDGDRAVADAKLAAIFPRTAPLVVLHPSGGRSALKQWPLDRFAELLVALSMDHQRDFLVIGGPGENQIGEFFRRIKAPNVALSVGGFTLREYAAIFARSFAFIGGDTGLMHLAAASGTRVIALLGSTSAIRFGPRTPTAHVISLRYPCSPDRLGTFENRCQRCRFDEPRCLTELLASEVIAATRLALA